MKTIEEMEKDGYEGTDAGLDISLYEYGMAWKADGEDYRFIYGVGVKENSEYYLFDWGCIAKNINPEKEWDFADFNAVAKCCGMKKADFLKQPLPFIVYDLVMYYGHENIFGSSYYPFEIADRD